MLRSEIPTKEATIADLIKTTVRNGVVFLTLSVFMIRGLVN